MSGTCTWKLGKPMTLRSGKGSALRASLLLAVALSAMLAVNTSAALGATSDTPYDLLETRAPSPQPTGRFGERHAAAGDLNGDGVNDYFIAANSQDVLGVANAGRVFAMSGRTLSVLWTTASPEVQAAANFGFFISNLGDVNGDGSDDLAVGTDAQDTTAAGASCTTTPPNPACNVDQGKAWVLNGRTGAVLYALNNPNPQSSARFGSRIGRAGDLNGDGVAESIMGASNNDRPAGCATDNVVEAGCRENEGETFIFNGRTGALVRTLNIPPSDRVPATCDAVGGAAPVTCGTLGLAVQGPGDVDGDGITDQLVNAGNLSVNDAGDVCITGSPQCNVGQGAMYLYSGATGAVLARIDSPVPEAGMNWGFQDAAPLAPGDVNRDGRADLYANGFGQDGPAGESQGRAWVFDGRATVENPDEHGVLLYEPKDPTPGRGGQFGWTLDDTDYNKDGHPDLYIGQSPHHVAGTDQSGGTYVFDGRDGALLRAFELPPGIGQPQGTGLGSNLGWSLAAPGDLNGDGEPDYLAGAPFQDSADNQDEGRSFAFLSVPPRAAGPPPGAGGTAAPFAGCPTLTANTIRGTAASNTITGSAVGDRIFAGTGNDVVDALAGDDCVDLGTGADRGQGGSGADLLVGGLGADRVSGSAGNDRINGEGDRDRLNGGTGNDNVIGGAGNDIIAGVFGNDRLHGVSGTDRISGSRGRDRINGGSGADVVSAGSSGDRVFGDQGSDRINGNSGNDSIRGNSGDDRITGSTGADRLAGDSGNDRINSRDGRRDRVSCGRGRDRVIADRFDRVARSCEQVSRG